MTSSSLAPQPAAGDVTRDLVTLPSALPRPFPTFEGLELHPRAPVPAPGLGKLLPYHCCAPPPDPWTWPGPGPVVPTYPSPLVVPGLPPVHAGPSRTFPDAVAGPLDLALLCWRKDLPPKAPFPIPLRLTRFFRGCHAPFPWSAPANPSTQVTVTPSQVIVTPSQVLPVTSQTLPNVQDWMKDMKDALLSSMKDQMIIGPDALRPSSSSGDRASPRAPHKSGSKRADGCSRSRSPSGVRSLSSWDWQSRRRPHSLSSSSDRLSPPSKRLRNVSHSPRRRSRSPDVSRRSPGPQRYRASPSHTDRYCSLSPASHRRSRTRPSLSRRPSPAGMTRRPARGMSLSPRRRSPSSSARRNPWGRYTSPPTRRMSPNRCGRSSCSGSCTPCPRRRSRARSHSPRSRSSS